MSDLPGGSGAGPWTNLFTHLALTYPARERGYDRRPAPLFDDASEARPRCIDDGRA